MKELVKIKLLRNILEEVTKQYDELIAAQNRELKEYFERAVKDQLTGLYNRYYLFEYANKSLQKLKREGKSAIVIFLDLDNFKYVNDQFGHKKGDEVLKEVASILKSTFRSCDIVARLGGDEFAIYIESPVKQNRESEDIEKLLSLAVERIESRFNDYHISASYGSAMFPKDGENLNELIDKADFQMYSKKRGKKRI